MRTAVVLLCLALVAGLAFANIVPATKSVPVVDQQELAQELFPDVRFPNLLPALQASHCEPYLGQCNTLTFGTCDCDVPVIVGTCGDFNGRNWFVSDCGHPVDYCEIVSYCAPD